MASSKFGARLLPRLAAGWLALAGCYATTPHKAEVASQAGSQADCAKAVAEVFDRSGFIQLPTPAHLSMFFGARTAGPYTSFLRTGAGVGVTVNQAGQGAGMCHVTIEALSPDANCPEGHMPVVCDGPNGGIWTNAVVGGSGVGDPRAVTPGAPSRQACPAVPPLGCEMSYAPGEDNDAAVDELARRVQAALGPTSHVSVN
jgi:hypothetical protein